MAAIQYFCYVSRNKVDQLYEQLNPEAQFDLTETRSKQTTLTADAHANWGIGHILSLFRLGGTYGKSGTIQREAKVKQSYMTKLEEVCTAIAADRPVPPAAEVATDSSGWFHHDGLFRVTKAVDNPTLDSVITISSDVNGRPLLLDCSLRNFSEGPMPDGTFALHSANARFFEADLSLKITTLFLVLEATDSRIVGSPLFLKLTLPDANTFIAL